MLVKLVRLLVATLRLSAIVIVSVLAGSAVALANSYMPNNDKLQIFGLFATFSVPVIVAWFLLQPTAPQSSEITDPPDGRVEGNGKEASESRSSGGTRVRSDRG